LNGDQAEVGFHTRPRSNARLEDFKLFDRFMFSPNRFHDDAMVPPKAPEGPDGAPTPKP